MKRVWIVFVALTFAQPAWAAKVCLERATGKLLEYQEHMAQGTCQTNWVIANPQYGYTADQIEERKITPGEWEVLQETAIRTPARAAQAAREVERKDKATAIKTKLGLSDTDMANLKAALGR